MTSAEVIQMPDRIVVRWPVGDTWTMLDLLDIQDEMKINPQELDQNSPKTLYLSVIADIWLQLRETEPGITWRDAAKRYNGADLSRDLQAAVEAAGPKAPTTGPRPARRRSP